MPIARGAPGPGSCRRRTGRPAPPAAARAAGPGRVPADAPVGPPGGWRGRECSRHVAHPRAPERVSPACRTGWGHHLRCGGEGGQGGPARRAVGAGRRRSPWGAGRGACRSRRRVTPASAARPSRSSVRRRAGRRPRRATPSSTSATTPPRSDLARIVGRRHRSAEGAGTSTTSTASSRGPRRDWDGHVRFGRVGGGGPRLARRSAIVLVATHGTRAYGGTKGEARDPGPPPPHAAGAGRAPSG